MVRLKTWQWVVLILPIAILVGFLIFAAGWQIHQWGLNWIWAIVTLGIVAWQRLLVRWLRAETDQIEAVIEQINAELIEIQEITPQEITLAETTHQETNFSQAKGTDPLQQAEVALQSILTTAKGDRILWEDWVTFWNRAQELVIAVAKVYHPEVKYPLLNIYIPQAYGLIRGTVDDLDRWINQLSPILNQITLAQGFQAYETYHKLEPSARKLWRVWNWAQWILNPAAAIARQATRRTTSQYNQELIFNLGQMLREVALRNLYKQAVNLYSGSSLPQEIFVPATFSPPQALTSAKTQTLRDLLSQAEPTASIAQKPINIMLVGRTGAGKSSLINSLFQADLAQVDILPSTNRLQNYHWQAATGESLNLWDSPGYEQISREDLRETVLDYASTADLLMLVTPALDPAIQMDVDFLDDIRKEIADIPVITLVSQVDRLRPIREWNPPYDWQYGDREKEISIRQATAYRSERLSTYSSLVLPIVTQDTQLARRGWNIDTLSLAIVDSLDPAKQLRIARFLKNLDARSLAAAQIIDHYTFQMATTQGLTTLLKSPVLQFLSTLTTGSPTLAYVLAQQIPVEQLPLVIGKLQMAYDLYGLLAKESEKSVNFELITLWPLLLNNTGASDRNAWALGQALVEYWTQDLTSEQLEARFKDYLAL
jgi:hypothetical protein